MCRRLLQLVILSHWFSGGFSEQLKRYVFLAGQVAILPCQYDDPLYVEWSRDNLEPNVVLLYRDGKEEHGMKNKAFHYRTSLVRPEMDSSDKSLRIANVQLSDEGNYTCKSNFNEVQVVKTVWLSVVNVSRPELTLVAGAKGPTVQCEVRSSSSKLEMEFLNDEGNVLPSDKLKFNSEDPDFLSVTREMLVPDSISSITCRVTETMINQTWRQTLSIPDFCKASSTPYINTIIIISVLSISVIIITAIFICSKYGHLLKTRSQPSSVSLVKGPSEKLPLIDDVDGSKIKDHGSYRKQQDKETPQASLAGAPQPAQPPAPSGFSASTGNSTPKEGKL